MIYFVSVTPHRGVLLMHTTRKKTIHTNWSPNVEDGVESFECARDCDVGISVFNLDEERIKKSPWTKGSPAAATVETLNVLCFAPL